MEMIDSLPKLLKVMKTCYQFENVNMLEHGKMVNVEYFKILSGNRDSDLPVELINLIKTKELMPKHLMTKYHILHDCGKPLIKCVDSDGKSHYPNHADVSAEQIKFLFPDEFDLYFLIKNDMEFHTKKTNELVELSKHKLGFALYLTAWAELFANSSMFGGVESVSYKIKRKKLMKHLKLFV